MKVSEKELIERLRKNHRCFAPAKKCAFFGFDSDVDLENKIYDFSLQEKLNKEIKTLQTQTHLNVEGGTYE